MNDEPTNAGPIEGPAPPPSDPESHDPESPDPVSPEPVSPALAGFGPRDVALGAIVFVATLLLLLGATRLVERGASAARPTSSGALAASPTAAKSASPVPSAGPTTGGSAAPTGSAASGQIPAPTGDPVLVGAGDIGDCGSDGDEATATLLDGIEGTVFTAGDNAYPSGTAQQFQKCYDPSWGRLRVRTRPAPGNHDWETTGLAGYLGYFGEAAQGPGKSSWYSYDLGTWHVIVLDSECDKVGGCEPPSPQGRWLAADLAASNATCTLAIFHRPRFTSGEHGDNTSMDAFWRPLYAAGVDVIVNGHDHDYERFDPQDPDGRADEARGIREFVVGTGGTQLRGLERTAPNSKVTLANGYGVLKFTLHDGSYDVEFIAAGNDFRDRGTGEKCH